MGNPPGRVLAAHCVFRSDDLDVARAAVARSFCTHTLDCAGEAGFSARQHRVQGRALSLNYIEYGAEVAIDPGELQGFYLIQLPLEGTALVRNGGIEVLSTPGLGSVLNPDRATRMRWHQGCRMALIQIDRAALAAFAERELGRSLPGAIRFDPAVRLDGPLEAWARLVVAAFAVAGAQGRVAGEDRLMAGFLAAQPGTMREFWVDGARRGGAVAVKRAVEFIHARADQEISLAAIADASGASLRSLQYGFIGTYGTSPMAYLRDERLRRVRAALLAADDGSVTGIAMAQGVAHMGRFAAAYRGAYGETPVQTLRGRGWA